MYLVLTLIVTVLEVANMIFMSKQFVMSSIYTAQQTYTADIFLNFL